MQDRVAEVLAQRAALENGAGAGIAVSLLLHSAITAAAIYAAIHQPAPQTANIVTIQLAPMQPAKTKPSSKSKSVTLREPKAIVEAPKTTVVAKPDPKTAPMSPFGRSTKKGTEVAPPPAPAVAAAPVVPDVPVGGTGVTGIEGGDFPYTIYIERMKVLIGNHWFRPQTVAPGTTTVVFFRIERDGTIKDAAVEKPSGNGTFDRAAHRAILESSPLPPLPMGYNGTFIGVHLTFK